MKTIKTILLAAAVALLPAVNADAQSLGGLLKKAQKTVEKVEKILTPTTTTQQPAKKASQGSAVTLANGVTMVNPLADMVDIELVGVYTNPVSENFANAYVVLKVNPLIPESKISFGSNSEFTMVAAGESGTLYKTGGAGIYPYDVVEGMPVMITMDKKDQTFQNVKRSEEMFSVLKVGVFIDYAHKGLVTFKNVPILWDQHPE